MSTLRHKRRGGGGFALIPALFLVIVLGALALVAIRVGTGQQHTVTMSLVQARAMAAARAGIEWGAYQALPPSNSCVASMTLNLSEAALNGYTVVVTCSSTAFAEGATTSHAYSISATATSGTTFTDAI
jgi:MSHA biogenesis protein MshP